MAQRGVAPPSSRSRDLAGEDFLFHLYRGSELLQDNRVHDAKAEIEQALSLQPSDPKGQDLLGIVYFRLGLYPRAITIYEELIRSHPDAIEPRINLALCYLKTGQPSQARSELERVVEQSPEHSRAWGYLGLAFQRLGDFERATYAFSAGGHDGMARRLVDMATAGNSGSLLPEMAASLGEARRASVRPPKAKESLRPPIDARPGESVDGRGSAEAVNGVASANLPPFSQRPQTAGDANPDRVDDVRMMPPRTSTFPSLGAATAGALSTPPRPMSTPPRRLLEFGRDALLVFPRDLGVSQHPGGLVLVRVTTGFSMRLEAVRAMTGTGDKEALPLQRRTRGRSLDEPLGGPTSPIVEVTGKGELVLGPAAGRLLHPVVLENDVLYLREDALMGFEAGVTYENGRLPLGDGDAVTMVLLRGPGTVVASLPETVATLEVGEGRQTTVRTVAVLGWLGHIVPHSVSASESPGGMRGLTAFAGEGMVLIDGR